MAAICGVFPTSTLQADVLCRQVARRMSYRGPDGFAHWSDEDAALGHGALRLDAERPAHGGVHTLPDGRICIVDGYVGNPHELARALGISPVATQLEDCELIAQAFQRWGQGLHAYIHGAYAIAIWDPAQHRLELVTDPLGARPVCYVLTRQFFAFASDALALLALPGISHELNDLGIVSLWYPDAVYGSLDHTAFVDVHQLPPASMLCWHPTRGFDIKRYWHMSPPEPLHLRDEREYIDAFREVFTAAVASSMQGASRSSLMLSGGLDSGAILAACKGFRADGRADNLLCISAVLSPQVQNPQLRSEDRNIRAMTDGQPWVRQFEVPPGGPEARAAAADLAEAAWGWMHPLDISLVVPSLVYRIARSEGCRIVLDGVEGDVVTSVPIHYISEFLRSGDVQGAWRESILAPKVNTYLRGSSKASLLGRGLAAAVEPNLSRRARGRWHARRQATSALQDPVMSAGLAERTGLAERLHAAASLRAKRDPQHRCDNMLFWMTFSVRGFNAVASRHGIEPRHPWCDLRVAKFFLSLPIRRRVKNGWTKHLVRRACESALGSDVVWHSGKAHLGSTLMAPMLDDAAPYLVQLMESQRINLKRYVRDEAITESINMLKSSRLEDVQNCDTIQTLAALSGWLAYVNDYYTGE